MIIANVANSRFLLDVKRLVLLFTPRVLKAFKPGLCARDTFSFFAPFCNVHETSRGLLANRMAKATKSGDFKNSPAHLAYANKFYSALLCREPTCDGYCALSSFLSPRLRHIS